MSDSQQGPVHIILSNNEGDIAGFLSKKGRISYIDWKVWNAQDNFKEKQQLKLINF